MDPRLVMLLAMTLLNGSTGQEPDAGAGGGNNEEAEEAVAPSVKILTENQTFYVQLHTQLTLPCELDQESEGSIVSWKKVPAPVLATNGRKTLKIPTYSVKKSPKLHELTLKKASENDAGVYACTVLQEPAVEVFFTVYVTRPPTVDIQPNESPVNLDKDTSYDISCIAKGFPQPTIRWYFKPEESNQRQTLEQFFNSSSIHLGNLQRENAGEYICEADNEVGEPATGSHRVLVQYAPEALSVPPVSLAKVGGEAKLECSFNAFPVAEGSVTWRKLEKPKEETTPPPAEVEETTLPQAEETDTETAAPESPTESPAEEQVPAETSAPAESDAENADQNVAEQNEHAGHRKRQADEGEEVHAGDKYDINTDLQGQSMRSTLVIKNVDGEDFRKYVCTAKNSMGVASQTVELSGLPYPIAVEQGKMANHEPLKYAVAWRVKSAGPVKEYRIIYREFNDTHQGDAKHITIPENDQDRQIESGDVRVYEKTHVIDNLRPFTNYSVQILVHNDYGWSSQGGLVHQFFMADSTSSPQIGGRSHASMTVPAFWTLAFAVFLSLLGFSRRREIC